MKSTTIKLSEATKKRLDALKVYERESYEGTINRMIDIINLCRGNPNHARFQLKEIDHVRDIMKRGISKKSSESKIAKAPDLFQSLGLQRNPRAS